MDAQIIVAAIGGVAAIAAACIQAKTNIIGKSWARIRGRTLSGSGSVLYQNKQELPHYRESIKKANTEICVLAVHAMNFVRMNDDLLTHKLSAGCKLKLLNLSLSDECGANPCIAQFEAITGHPAVREDIVASNAYIQNWISSLGGEIRSQVEVRHYNSFPTALYLMVDKELEGGFAMVEPILPYVKTNDRPVIRVTKKDNDKLLSQLARSFEMMWQRTVSEKSTAGKL